MKKSVVAAILASSLILSSCGGYANIQSIPLVPELSKKEATDYYAAEMQYDNVVARNITEDSGYYETVQVASEVEAGLKQKQKAVEAILAQQYYTENEQLTRQQFNYIKAGIDSFKLSNSVVKSVENYLDYYFVDVEYTTSENSNAQLLAGANYLGIHGAWIDHPLEGEKLDNTVIRLLEKLVSGDITLGGLEQSKDIEVDNTTTVENIENAADNGVGDAEQTEAITPTPKPEQINIDTSIPLSGRKSELNIKEYNSKAGGSLGQTAIFPMDFSGVFIPTSASTLAGYGIFNGGNYGIKSGLGVASITGTIQLRYVFKKDYLTGDINTHSVFISGYESNLKSDYTKEITPEFVMADISILVERLDRAIMNNDIPALFSGEVVSDIGAAIQHGFKQRNSHVMRHLSSLKSVIKRDLNSHIVEVESVTQEGPRGSQVYGTYKNTYIMEIKQSGIDTTISDIALVSSELIKHPKLELDSSITKQLASLGLRGSINDTAKQEINTLLQNLYTGSNERSLVKIYANYSEDTTLLSSDRLEYLNSQVRSWLIKHGTNRKSVYQGHVIEWMGGSEDQAEIITEECITYDGVDSAQYMTVYYLVSKFSGEWKIVESKVITNDDIVGNSINDVLGRIQN